MYVHFVGVPKARSTRPHEFHTNWKYKVEVGFVILLVILANKNNMELFSIKKFRRLT